MDPSWLYRIAEDGDAEGDVDHGVLDAEGDAEAVMDEDD